MLLYALPLKLQIQKNHGDIAYTDYHWWKNPHWGTPQETVHKVKRLYASGRVYQTTPVPGALEGAQKLREMGYTLVIVTAREKEEMEHTERWLERHFSGDCLCAIMNFHVLISC